MDDRKYAMQFEKSVVQDIQKQIASNGDSTILRGLTNEEVEVLQAKFRFQFPPDLLCFLKVGVPVNSRQGSTGQGIPPELPAQYQTANDRWHNWHNLLREEVSVGSEEDTITKQILWHATPGEGQPHPAGTPLIPIYAHRMIPAVPHQCGNPVFSMHGCYDNIIYGNNFWDWLLREKLASSIPNEWRTVSTPLKDIPFWQDYIG